LFQIVEHSTATFDPSLGRGLLLRERGFDSLTLALLMMMLPLGSLRSKEIISFNRLLFIQIGNCLRRTLKSHLNVLSHSQSLLSTILE
jgi:hypothetical protein